MKPILKVGFVDYWNPLDDYILEALSPIFDIERDDENPEYLFFCDETFGHNNIRYDTSKVTKIFFQGENRRPWNYQAHYSFGYDFIYGDQFLRFPLYNIDNWWGVKQGLLDMHVANRQRNFTSEDWERRTEFCGFVSGNGVCKERNDAFHLLCRYNKVDSAGPLFNNIGYVIPRGYEAQKHKMDFLSKYRFNLCYENGTYPGYVTEKIVHAFVAGCIPIYWGSPVIEMDFDSDTFINRHNYNSDLDMVHHIEQIDKSKDLWLEMMNKHFISKYNRYCHTSNFSNWFRDNVYKGTQCS